MRTDFAIRVREVSKVYRLGAIGHGTLRRDLQSWWARLRGRDDPNTHVGRLPGESPNHPAAVDGLFRALQGISFDLPEGEVLGVIGRNGAGKSTLLKIISRITVPTGGSIRLRGRVASLLEVGTGFHPELTGRENVFLNGAILGMRRHEIARKFDEIVDFSGISQFIDTPVKRYSSGMYVRLAFAVVAYLDADILLVDEVLAVGDADFQKRCVGKMHDVARGGRTVLLVSHNMASIMNLCNRAIVLEHGRLAFDGDVEQAVQRYLRSGGSGAANVEWSDPVHAPGNPVAALRAVRILQGNPLVSAADVDISKDIIVEIDYWARRGGEKLYTGLWLRDAAGTAVLSSVNHKSVSLTPDPWNLRPHPPGLYRSRCIIPGNFLNEGIYSVAALVGRNMSDTQVLQDNAVSFQVHDTGEMRKEYSGQWLGTVRPKLAWNTTPLEAPAESAERRVVAS
jgi:lipopolysaccharide transport system ATP-binding protein